MEARIRIGRGIVASAVVAGALATVAAPVAAAEVSAARTPCAQNYSRPLNLLFDKNPSAPTNSRLYVCQGNRTLASYRAGSGLGSTDECRSEKGWLPNGTYPITFHTRSYNGSEIKGYAVALPDMWCTPRKNQKRVKRTALFIHSEMNRDGSQGTSEPRKWNGPSDYKSYGCIKLSPVHIRNLFNLFDHKVHAWPSRLRVVA